MGKAGTVFVVTLILVFVSLLVYYMSKLFPETSQFIGFFTGNPVFLIFAIVFGAMLIFVMLRSRSGGYTA